MSQTTLAIPAPEPAASLPLAVIAARVRTHGRCTLEPPTAEDDPWFPVTEIPQRLEAEAEIACHGCRVVPECLVQTLHEERVLVVSDIHGIRAAMAPHQRISLMRQRGLIAEARA